MLFKVDEDIAIRVADSIPRILNWKTIAESPWIFVVFDIGQRSLEVYDSFPVRDGVNLDVKNIVEMLSVVLPYYLSVVKFYDKRPELKSTPKYSEINEVEKIKFHFINKGVPKQQEDSL